MKKIVSAGCMFLFLSATAVKAQTTPKVVLENNKVKVSQFDSAPGKDVCGAGKHSHPAHLTILITAATVTITTGDGRTVTQRVPAGTAFWSEAEIHTVINTGNLPVKGYIVETK